MAEIKSLRKAIAELVRDGDTVAMEGFTHLIPFAAGHEVIRQQRKNLTLVRMAPDVIYDQLIGAGCAKKLIFSWGGNPGVGSLHRLRDAVEHDWPLPLEIQEHGHGDLSNAYVAGASKLPFAVLRAYAGSDLPKQAVLAAKKAIITVEEIVDDLKPWPNACILPSWTISAVCCVPGGAFPSYAHGYYQRDNRFYQAWDAVARDRETFQSWIRRYGLETENFDEFRRVL